MGNIPRKEEMLSALSERVGIDMQNKFQNATVAICGLGGLGSNIAILLARAGIGKLLLIDFDCVDITNLNRQQYKAAQIGKFKTDALEENIKEITPYIELRTFAIYLREENCPEVLAEADIICEAFDNAEEKSKLVNYILENMPNKYIVAASGMAGLDVPNKIKTRKITKKFYLCGDGESTTDNGESLFAPRVMVCAAHQATTVLRIIAEKYDV